MNIVLCFMPSGELGVFLKLNRDGIMSFDTEMHCADMGQIQIICKGAYKDAKNLIIFSVDYLLKNRPSNVEYGMYEALCLL